MAWLESIHTPPGQVPQDICINLDHVRFFRPKSDGTTLVIFAAQGQAHILNEPYVDVIARLLR